MGPEELTETIRSYQASRTLLTAVELDVFGALGEGAAADALARRLGTDSRATEALLNALVALGVLTKHNGIFRNTPVAARFLAPPAERLALLHSVGQWKRWSTLTECVRAGTSVSYQEWDSRGEEWYRAFMAAMHRFATERAPFLVEAVGAEGVRRMLDAGGGSGAHALAFARANPALRADILDVAAVLPITQEHIQAAGLADRVTTRTGDLRNEPLGEGYDLVLLSSVCHIFGPEENVDLLRRCFQALVPGGRVAIHDFILEPDKTSPRNAAMFTLNMLVSTERGASYSRDEYEQWLRGVGFNAIRFQRLPCQSDLMLAVRPIGPA